MLKKISKRNLKVILYGKCRFEKLRKTEQTEYQIEILARKKY